MKGHEGPMHAGLSEPIVVVLQIYCRLMHASLNEAFGVRRS